MSENAAPILSHPGKFIEEFQCCCLNVVRVKGDLIGLCPNHGTDVKRVTRIPKGMEMECGYDRS